MNYFCFNFWLIKLGSVSEQNRNYSWVLVPKEVSTGKMADIGNEPTSTQASSEKEITFVFSPTPTAPLPESENMKVTKSNVKEEPSNLIGQ